MSLRATAYTHVLQFRFEAGTSRGILTEKPTYFIKIYDTDQPEVFGLGECGPLKGLSADDLPDFADILQRYCRAFNRLDVELFSWNLNIIVDQLVGNQFPSIRFGFETALLDFLNGGKRQIFDNDFSQGQSPIKINGLIWMGAADQMLRQIEEKLEAGYTCLKLKIGAIDFDQELRLLGHVRQHFDASQITLRVDANGAFSADTAHEKLQRLAEYELHSIEQPIKPRQKEHMAALCENSPVPVALDEELIGVTDYMEKLRLLKALRPPYIILKPTLLGGFQHCREWIEIANRLKIKWWITSALESNVGLNAVSQFTAQFNNPLPQGLGTGQLYHNNVPSPLHLEGENLFYSPSLAWDTSMLAFEA